MPIIRSLLLSILALTALGGCTTAPTLLVTPTDADLLIRNGRVLDGSGRPAFPADIAIRNGRILAIASAGNLAHLRATRTVDAQQLGLLEQWVGAVSCSNEVRSIASR